MTYLPYDKTDEKSIEAYAKRLIGHTFLDVLDDAGWNKAWSSDCAVI